MFRCTCGWEVDFSCVSAFDVDPWLTAVIGMLRRDIAASVMRRISQLLVVGKVLLRDSTTRNILSQLMQPGHC